MQKHTSIRVLKAERTAEQLWKVWAEMSVLEVDEAGEVASRKCMHDGSLPILMKGATPQELADNLSTHAALLVFAYEDGGESGLPVGAEIIKPLPARERPAANGAPTTTPDA